MKPGPDVILEWNGRNKELIFPEDGDGGFRPTLIAPEELEEGIDLGMEIMERYGEPGNHNLIFKGDSLLVLKLLGNQLLQRSQEDLVKCIYIDPPFNTGNSFEHYNDKLTHSSWLSMMQGRLRLMRDLLREDGAIFVHVGVVEVHYLKVLMDEIFGRDNFVSDITVGDSKPSGMKTAHRDRTVVRTKSHILLYRKSDRLRLKPQYRRRRKWDTHFMYFLRKSGGELSVIPLKEVLQDSGILEEGQGLSELDIQDGKFRKFMLENVDSICQTQYELPAGIRESSRSSRGRAIEYRDSMGRARYALNGRRLAPLAETLNPVGIDGASEDDISLLLGDIWDDVDFNNTQNEGGVPFTNSKKPEFLIARILSMATREGDLCLDAFAGSGTTAAVAHKMGRSWIAIEMGGHAETHIMKRMKSVVDGTDRAGVSRALKWEGGGGFSFIKVTGRRSKE